MRMAAAVAASDSTARSAITFCIAGCSASSFPKALRWRAWCSAWVTPAHRRRRPDQAVEPGVVDHADDRGHAPALLAHQPAAHALELDLAGGQRAGAELVLEPLDAKAGVASLDQEAREPGGGLGQGQEHVARRIGAEPLVAGDLVGAVARRLGAGGVGPHVRTALLLGHRHPGERAAGVGGTGQERLPHLGQVGLGAQRGDGRVGHRHRAHHAGVDLAPDEEGAGAHHVRSGPGITPRKGVQLALDGLAQQPVPRRVEVDLVDAVAVAVMGAQDGLVSLRALGVLERLGRAGQLAGVAQAVDAPAAALALERLAQCEVGLEGVVRRQRGRLVRYVVSGGAGEHALQVSQALIARARAGEGRKKRHGLPEIRL